MAGAHPSLQPSLARPSARIPALDGFRAIAIVFVMLSHVGLERIVPGQFGVTLFFFLSGYLITSLIRKEFEKTQTVSLRLFYFRRSVRILPPLMVAVALATVCSLMGWIGPLNASGMITDIVFLSNYFPSSGMPIGLWSLAVEEHFYAVFPVLALLCFAKRGVRECAAACALACILVLAVRLFEVGRVENIRDINFWTHTRIDSILYGAMLACWNNPMFDAKDRLPGRWVSYAIVVVLMVPTFVIRDEVFRQTLRYSIQGIALLVLFNAAIRDAAFARRILDSGLMQIIASLSYTLYLVHSIFVHAAKPLVPVYGFVPTMAGALVVSFGFAWAVREALERPLETWRRGMEARWRAVGSRRVANAAP